MNHLWRSTSQLNRYKRGPQVEPAIKLLDEKISVLGKNKIQVPTLCIILHIKNLCYII
jgi:hypothetical protein